MKTSENQITAQLAEIFKRTINSEVIEGIGDDCAVLRSNALVQTDPRFVVTTDVLVEDVHFKSKWSTATDVAARAFAQNLADVAAMGARGTAMLVGLVVPRELPEKWLIDFANSFSIAASNEKVAVVGGDLTSGPKLIISVTAIGALDGRQPVKRSGAQIGDWVAISGELGFSSLGFELITATNPNANPKAVQRYLVPKPPYSSGPAAALAGASAMIDISDGLAVDAERLARASRVSIQLHPSQAQKSTMPNRNYYFGGEDHALLACFPPGKTPPKEFHVIGQVMSEEYALENGKTRVFGPDLDLMQDLKGWDHFDV